MVLLPPSGWRRVVSVGVWAAAVAVTLLLGWQTTVGPVLVGFTARHGVHLGDLAVAANTATGAAVVTYMLASRRRTPVARLRRGVPHCLADDRQAGGEAARKH
jgi:hypothetical protein